MNEWHIASAVASAIAAVFMLVVILHPGIKEGMFIKLGLVGLVLSLSATAYLTYTESTNWPAYWRAGFMTRVSVCFVAFGLLLKASAIGKARRRADQPIEHLHKTRRIIRYITEPVNDLAHLFSVSEPAQLEQQKEQAK